MENYKPKEEPINHPNSLSRSFNTKLTKQEQVISYSEKEMLVMLHKFGFDYTYNYGGGKTIYEWIPEWFEEYKKLEEKHKNK
jgi:hypothetical protein